MYILKQGNLIVYTAKTEDEINSVKEYMPFDEIVETEEVYTLVEGAYLTEETALVKAKEKKHAENTQKAKMAVENGYATFKNAKFETNAQTVGDLTATMLMLQAQNNRHSEPEAKNPIDEQEDISSSALNMTDSCHSEALLCHPEALAEGSNDIDLSPLAQDDNMDSSAFSKPQNDGEETDLSVSLKPQDDNMDSSVAPLLQNDTDVILSETKDLTTVTSPTVQNDNITYTWLSKDDKLVTLTLEDFVTLGSLIAEYKNSIWNGKYIAFKTAIEQAETLKELEKIEINYADSNI